MTVAFRVYYGDGSTYDGAPERAPALNVQAIGRFINVTRSVEAVAG